MTFTGHRKASHLPGRQCQDSVPDRLQAYEHHLTERLESLKEARVGFDGLYETLTPGQKKTADELVAPVLLYF